MPTFVIKLSQIGEELVHDKRRYYNATRHILTRFHWNHTGRNYTGWGTVEADNKDAVLKMIPDHLRFKTRIFQLGSLRSR